VTRGETLTHDLRHAVRGLWRTPGFTAAAVVTLSLGIGANTAVFSVVDGVLLNPLPFPDPSGLVAVYGTNQNNPKNSISYSNFEDVRNDVKAFDAMAAWRTHSFTLTGRGDAEALFGTMVSADLFDVLRIGPVAGRVFRRDEDRPGAAPVAMVGENYWRARFDADPGIVGRELVLNGRAHTVVGVVPSVVRLAGTADITLNDVYVPLGQYDDPLYRIRGVNNGTIGLARLRRGVTLEAARAEAAVVAERLERQFPDDNRGVGVNVVALTDDVGGDRRPALMTLLGAVGLVLFVACANVGNLILARSSLRRHELAVRVALGAGRRRLVAQFLAESILISTLGCAMGVALAVWLTRVGVTLLPEALPAMSHVGLNLRVLAFAVGASCATAIALGVLPGLRAGRLGAQTHLAERAWSTRTRARGQRALVVAELALTLVLLAGAGLLIQSLAHVRAVDAGLDPAGVLTFRTALSSARSATPDAVRAAFRDLDARLAQVPGVIAASVDIGAPPFNRGSSSWGFRREGEPPPSKAADEQEAIFHAVGAGYLRAMGIPLLRGRELSPLDHERAPRVMIVDEELAGKVFPNQEAVGQRILLSEVDTPWEIVGVVRHVRHWGLDRDDTALVRAQFYIPHSQIPDFLAPLSAGSIGGVVRSAEPSPSLLAAVRREVSRFDAGQAVHGERTMTGIIDASLAERRFSMVLLTAFALLSLLLAVVGTYGVMAYTIAQRTSEIGLRMAVGARPSDIVRMLARDGQRMVLGGMVIGLPAAWLFGQLLAGQLFGVGATDPATFAGVAGVLAAAILAACLAVARRATRIDPLVALRQE
jgi:predicted permease